MNRYAPVGTTLFALFASPIAMAQQPSANQPPATISTLPTVTVQGAAVSDDFTVDKTSLNKLPADLRDIPQSITVVDKALMQSQGVTSLADALRNVPGITLGGAEGGQIGNNINLNGFSARTDIYLDGFRDRGQYYRDTFALDQVEVLMGPSSMLFGRGSTGGVINQVTKTPHLKQSTELTGSVTSNGLVRSTIDYNQPTSATSAFRLNAMAQDGRPGTRDKMSLQDFGFAPSFKMGIGTPTEITLSALVQHNNDMPDYGVSPLNGKPVNVDRNTFYGYTNDRTIQDIAALSATIKHTFNPGLTLRNQTQYNSVHTNARETASNTIGTVNGSGFHTLPGATPGSTLPLSDLFVRLQSHDRNIHDSSLFNQTELTAKFHSGSIKHTLLVGTEVGYDKYDNQGYYRNGTCNGVPLTAPGATSGYVGCEPLIDPRYTSSPSNVASLPGNLAKGSATTLAAYISDTIELSRQFKLVGGVRYDHYDARISNSINSSNTAGSTTLGSTNQTVNLPSWRAGAIWQPTNAQSYYVSYSTSFNPSLEQLTSTTGLSQPLPPEKNKSYEFGGKWDMLDGNLSLNSALFQITQFNSRSQNADNTYTANGTVRVNGFRAGATGRITNKWQVFGGYTHMNASIVDAIAPGTLGMTPSNTPKDSASIWTTYDFMPHWQIGGGATYLSSRYANNTDLVKVNSYVRLDAMLAYHQPRYDVRLNVFNLANTKYYDALIQSDGGRAVPGTGRTVMLSVAYRM
jgi:catecholate siderophore receptor